MSFSLSVPLSFIPGGPDVRHDVGVNSVDAFEHVFQGKAKANDAIGSVGCIFSVSNNQRRGTAVLVAKEWVLTASHVIGNALALPQNGVHFGYVYNGDGSVSTPPATWTYGFGSEIITVGGGLDFSLIRLKENDAATSPVAWPSDYDGGASIMPPPIKKIPKVMDKVSVIQHRSGRPKTVCYGGRVAGVHEEVAGARAVTFVDHDLFTQDGSSGAAIVDSEVNWVAVHVAGTDATGSYYPGNAAYNRAVSIVSISRAIYGIKGELFMQDNVPNLLACI